MGCELPNANQTYISLHPWANIIILLHCLRPEPSIGNRAAGSVRKPTRSTRGTEIAESNISGLNQAFDAVGKCDRQANYSGWTDKNLLAVLDGVLFPTAVGLNSADVAAWKKANTRLFSVLFFLTTGSAHITVKAHQDNTPGSVGDGAAAC